MATSVQQSGVVVGYFQTGQEAHRAIQALVDDGFLPSEIGAAFHVGASDTFNERGGEERSQGAQPNIGGSLREELGTTLPGNTAQGTRVGTSSASSDTSSVQYAALGGGAGTPFDGAGKPKPISGSSLANTGLPSELRSELPHDAGLPHSTGAARNSSVPFAPEPTVHTAAGRSTGESWTDRLKHIFSPSSHSTAAGTQNSDTMPKAPVTKESQDFGTGEGHLMLNTGLRYSQPAFERSFSEYGVQPEHARHLSHRIGHGGAIVTIHASTRSMEAERILESHGGEVRFSAGGAGQTSAASESHVEVFGTVGRNYTGYFD